MTCPGLFIEQHLWQMTKAVASFIARSATSTSLQLMSYYWRQHYKLIGPCQFNTPEAPSTKGHVVAQHMTCGFSRFTRHTAA